jgi:hypothetical protein
VARGRHSLIYLKDVDGRPWNRDVRQRAEHRPRRAPAAHRQYERAAAGQTANFLFGAVRPGGQQPEMELLDRRFRSTAQLSSGKRGFPNRSTRDGGERWSSVRLWR